MFTLTIQTENAAFGDDDVRRDAEIARILRRVVYDLEHMGITAVGLYDVNGNRVGEARYT